MIVFDYYILDNESVEFLAKMINQVIKGEDTVYQDSPEAQMRENLIWELNDRIIDCREALKR